MVQVLVVDDEPAVRAALRRALALRGYQVELAEHGDEALDAIARRPPDLVVLDIAMPRRDGLAVCRELRSRGDKTPVLMLTARETVSDRVEGLEAGADDYLVKPFALDELIARVRALLRRGGVEPDGVLAFGDLHLNTATREAFRGGRKLDLTLMEFNLLELFLRNPRQVLTRPLIFERVWGYDLSSSSNALDVYIGYLRRKTEAAGEPRLIQTVRGLGYALRES
jgi:two-component system response regulator MprA